MFIATLAKRSGSFITLLLLALVVLTPGIGAALTADQQQVIQVTESAVHSRVPNTTYTPNVTEIAIVGSYALTTWTLGEGGGQAALQKKSSGSWVVLGMGGGQMDASTLVSFGVPSATATSLESALGPVPTPTP
jgi:hypothetical protein